MSADFAGLHRAQGYESEEVKPSGGGDPLPSTNPGSKLSGNERFRGQAGGARQFLDTQQTVPP